eukprot:6590932-Lingulodinium_polyedra.AAC.1
MPPRGEDPREGQGECEGPLPFGERRGDVLANKNKGRVELRSGSQEGQRIIFRPLAHTDDHLITE